MSKISAFTLQIWKQENSLHREAESEAVAHRNDGQSEGRPAQPGKAPTQTAVVVSARNVVAIVEKVHLPVPGDLLP